MPQSKSRFRAQDLALLRESIRVLGALPEGERSRRRHRVGRHRLCHPFRAPKLRLGGARRQLAAPRLSIDLAR
jgi:hypothetical protein